jgi:hypothetical protein
MLAFPGSSQRESEPAVTVAKPGTRPSSVQDDELLPESQILDGKIGLGCEDCPDDRNDGSESEHPHLVYLRVVVKPAKAAVYSG